MSRCCSARSLKQTLLVQLIAIRPHYCFADEAALATTDADDRCAHCATAMKIAEYGLGRLFGVHRTQYVADCGHSVVTRSLKVTPTELCKTEHYESTERVGVPSLATFGG